MALNFNVDPYYDDFDPSKHFHRILYQPGYAVQARELTQSQTILQDQITKFANHFFRQNTPITGGKVTVNQNCYYLKLQRQYLNRDISAAAFLEKTIQDSTGTILGKVIATAEGIDGGDYPTLIISYRSGLKFTDGLLITPNDGTNIAAYTIGSVGGTTSTGLASAASISEGVFYVINGYSTSSVQNADGTYSKYSVGNFVGVQPQTVILSKYNNTPSVRVGLNINESIVTYSEDTSLLDPAVGASNYQAPGANRYKIELELTTLPLAIGDDASFIELVRMDSGIIAKQVDDTVYSVIDDYFAKRTYDTNGDYIVNNFKFTPTSNTINSSQYDLRVGKGVAYVRGYRLENQTDAVLTGNRARDTANVLNNPITIEFGNYFFVSNVRGSSANSIFNFTTMQSVDLHTVPASQIVSSTQNTYNSTKVGTAKIRSMDFSSFGSAASNTSSYIYRAYVFDIAANTLSSNANTALTSATTIQFFDPSNRFSSTSNAYLNAVITIDSGPSAGDSRYIVSYNGTTKTANVNSPFSTTLTANSVATLRFTTDDVDSIVVANPSTFAVVSSANIDNTGRVGGLATGATTLQDAGNPELIYTIGYPFVNSTIDTSFTSSKIFRSKAFTAGSLTLTLPSSSPSTFAFLGQTGTSLSQGEVLQYFTVVRRDTGEIVDFTSNPGSNNIVISANKQTATFTHSALGSTVCDIIADVSVTNGDNSSYVLKAKYLVTGNTLIASGTSAPATAVSGASTVFVDTTNGQTYIPKASVVGYGNKQSLYVSDVKKIRKIIDTLSPSTAPTAAMMSAPANDITSRYTFDNGQRDGYYDHASITLRPGAPIPQGNIVVVYDFYNRSSADGYFSVMSYLAPLSSSPENYAEIGTYTSSGGTQYNLRDSIDFRPTRQNKTVNFVFDYSADPTSSDSGVYIPLNLSTYTSDYYYYLGKKAIVALSRERNFQLIEGESAINPVYPKETDGALVVARLNLDPYTAYVPGENPTGTIPSMSLDIPQLRTWKMKDITGLSERINNLEYYASLSLLEQNASSLQVKDVNGLNRFKNGILVDDFSSFAVADTSNLDFSASINKRTRQLSAAQVITNYPLTNLATLYSLGNLDPTTVSYKVNRVNMNTNLFSLPYSAANAATQKIASTAISVNPFNVSVIEGVIDLTPPMDNWVDNTQAPELIIVDPNLQIFQASEQVNVLSQGDWKVVPGTQETSSETDVIARARRSITFQQTITTTADQTRNSILGAYTQLNNTYDINSNYITDISIQPYIRPQQIGIRAKGMTVNTPLKAWFDGIRVDDYLRSPDSIELIQVNGTFKDDDLIGYYANNEFYPIATVMGSYRYPNSSNVRLYIVGNYQTSYDDFYSSSDYRIQSAVLDDNGNYVASSSNTAYGSLPSTQIISVHRTGVVSSVGNTFQDINGTAIRYYRVNTGHGPFAEMFGIWSSPKAEGLNMPPGRFVFDTTPTGAGTYWLRIGSDGAKRANTRFTTNNGIRIDGVQYWASTSDNGGSGKTRDFSVSLTTGLHYLDINVESTKSNGDDYIALAVAGPSTTNPWTSATTANKPIVISSATLQGNGRASANNAGIAYTLPGGGIYFNGVTELSLSGIASNVASYYVGSRINIETFNITQDVYGKVTTSTENYSATVTNYNNLNNSLTVDTPVNLSIGTNINVGGDITSTYTLNGTYTSYSLGIQGGGLSQLSTDEAGNYYGVFHVPQGIFKTGDRIFRLDDRIVDGDPSSADTFSEATFTAHGLATRSQALNFAASIAGAKNTFTRTDYRQGATISQTTRTYKIRRDPLAQTFIFDSENYPYGLFLDSIKLYFRAPPSAATRTGTLRDAHGTTSPITLSIVGTQNGYPNGETLDYSIVTLQSDEVNVSDTPFYNDPTTATVFKFPAPVFVQPEILYSIILKSSSNDYYPHIAVQGETTIASTSRENITDPIPTIGQKIGTNPYVGSLFESQNGITWVAEPRKSMMMIIDRCVFNTSIQPTITFALPNNLPSRRNMSSYIQYYKDSNIVPNTDSSYNYNDIPSHAINLTTTELVPSSITSIGYTYNSTLSSTRGYSGETLVNPGKYGSPLPMDISLGDGLGERVLVANSSNSFVLKATLSSTDDSVSPMISDDGVTLYNVQYQINNLGLSNNNIIVINGGTGYNGPGTPNANVTISAPDVAGGGQAYGVANVVNGNVISVYVTVPGSGYLNTPTITITGPNTSQAIVNVASEFSPKGGNSLSRYITRNVSLTPQNESEDLRVYFTAYRDRLTQIYVFYKIQSPNDTGTFEDNNWQLMTLLGTYKNIYSTDESDLIEYVAAPGVYGSGVANNYVSYTATNGQTYNSFTTFAIKIVMTTSDNTVVPFLTDLRVLALPSGTGI